MAPGHKSADVCEKFAKSRKDGNSGWWAVQCARSAMQGIPERLKKHDVEICESDIPKNDFFKNIGYFTIPVQ